MSNSSTSQRLDELIAIVQKLTNKVSILESKFKDEEVEDSRQCTHSDVVFSLNAPLKSFKWTLDRYNRGLTPDQQYDLIYMSMNDGITKENLDYMLSVFDAPLIKHCNYLSPNQDSALHLMQSIKHMCYDDTGLDLLMTVFERSLKLLKPSPAMVRYAIEHSSCSCSLYVIKMFIKAGMVGNYIHDAVIHKNGGIVELLMDQDHKVMPKSVLLAIQNNDIPIAKLLLEEPLMSDDDNADITIVDAIVAAAKINELSLIRRLVPNLSDKCNKVALIRQLVEVSDNAGDIIKIITK